MDNQHTFQNTGNDTPPKIKEKPATDTGSDKPSTNDNGESQVQDGEEIVNQEEQTKVVNEEAQEEFLDNTNNITIPKDEATRLGKSWQSGGDDDDDEEDDDDDDDDGGVTIGDDPTETKKKIPVM